MVWYSGNIFSVFKYLFNFRLVFSPVIFFFFNMSCVLLERFLQLGSFRRLSVCVYTSRVLLGSIKV